MRYQDAKKLHCGDQVELKETGEIIDVILAWTSRRTDNDQKIVLIAGVSNDFGYNVWWHTEVK